LSPQKKDKEPRLRSDLHKKIMQFFEENQGSIDTPRGVSAWVNENVTRVREALETLAKKGLLKAHRTSSTVAYSCALGLKRLAKITGKKK
jgi:hypothetical protein